MAGNKLIDEIQKYLGIPYFSNTGRHQTLGDNAYVGKGSAKEIALATIDLANQQQIKLLELSSLQIHNFQQKNHIGIDCSGYCCQLLNHLFNAQLDVRKTSADMLTSAPISKTVDKLQPGDLIRQKKGHHVLFVVSVDNDQVTYTHSSKTTKGVVIETKKITDIQHQGFFRLFFLN